VKSPRAAEHVDDVGEFSQDLHLARDLDIARHDSPMDRMAKQDDAIVITDLEKERCIGQKESAEPPAHTWTVCLLGDFSEAPEQSVSLVDRGVIVVVGCFVPAQTGL